MDILRITSLTIALLFSTLVDAASADVFELADGETLSGQLVERGKLGEFVIETDDGAMVTLSRKQVQRVEQQDEAQLEYERRSRSTPDTVDGHRELVEWCKQNQLGKLADHHRQRILQLDPDDRETRESLGYQQHLGRWLTRDEIMASRGLILYEGNYRTPQDIALREREKQREQAEAEWLRNLRLWRSWLDGRRSAEAASQIAEVRDPHAAVALAKMLKDERDLRVRELLTATLAELQHPLAVTTLVDLSLDDPDREVRLQCLDYLLKYHAPIRLTPYVKALKDRDNEIVNRAAEALKQLGNPAAISPLIDALVTTHRYSNRNAPPGQINPTFTKDGLGGGGGGLSVGGNSKTTTKTIKNIEVRRALMELSGGQDFEFNETAWRRWFVNQQVQAFVDTRRDD